MLNYEIDDCGKDRYPIRLGDSSSNLIESNMTCFFMNSNTGEAIVGGSSFAESVVT